MMPTQPRVDLWKMYLRDQVYARRAYRAWRDERFYRALMSDYPGKPAAGTVLRVKNGKHRLALVRL